MSFKPDPCDHSRGSRESNPEAFVDITLARLISLDNRQKQTDCHLFDPIQHNLHHRYHYVLLYFRMHLKMHSGEKSG